MRAPIPCGVGALAIFSCFSDGQGRLFHQRAGLPAYHPAVHQPPLIYVLTITLLVFGVNMIQLLLMGFFKKEDT